MVAFFYPNSQACESRLLVSASAVSIGVTEQPATFFQPTAAEYTCRGERGT